MRYCSLLLILIPTLSFSQTSSFDIVGSLDYAYRTISADENDIVAQAIYNNRKEHESALIKYQYGVNYNIGIGSRLSIKTGIRAAHFGYRYLSESLRWGNQHNGTGGFDPNVDPNFSTIQYESRTIYTVWAYR